MSKEKEQNEFLGTLTNDFKINMPYKTMSLEEVIATYGDNLTKAEIEELQKLNNNE